MTGQTSELAKRTQALRLAFDESFAHEARRETTAMENLLALRLGTDAYALRLSEISGLFVGRRITPVPGGGAALLGVAGFRGAMVPVYDLAALLGRQAGLSPRWLAIAAGAPAALAFETFDGHLRVPRETITPREADRSTTQMIAEFVSTQDQVRQVVHLPSVVDAIRAQLPAISRG